MAVPIKLKYSATTAAPGSLANGEAAFSANSDVLFIGREGAVISVGGRRYPGTLTANQALVANATGYLDVLKTANLYIGSVTVNTINAVANSTVLGAASNNELTTTWAIKTYIDETVSASAGKIAGNGMSSNTTHYMVAVGNSQLVSNSTGLWVAQAQLDHDSLSNFVANEHVDHSGVSITAGNGLTGGGTIAASRSLSVVAGTGVTVNATGVHIGQAVATSDSPSFVNLTLTGNLTINGTLSQVDATNLVVKDPLIKLGNGNFTTDTVDLGFYGTYGNSTVTQYSGLFRDASNSAIWTLFNTQLEPTTTIDTSNNTYALAHLNAYLKSGGLVSNGTNIAVTANSTLAVAIVANTLTLSTQLGVASGGTGLNTITTNGILVGNGTGAMGVITGTDGLVLASVSGVPTFVSMDGGSF